MILFTDGELDLWANKIRNICQIDRDSSSGPLIDLLDNLGVTKDGMT